jgi:hypothetical protein
LLLSSEKGESEERKERREEKKNLQPVQHRSSYTSSEKENCKKQLF